SAWDFHNAARSQFLNNNFGESVELEKKGMAIAEIMGAKKLLSDGLFKKAETVAAKPDKNNQMPDEVKQLLKESLKYNEWNEGSLKMLAKFNFERFQAHPKDEEYLNEAKGCLDKVLLKHPDDKDTIALYRKLTEKPAAPAKDKEREPSQAH